MLDILNLGAGVQSTAVLLMSVAGELPRLDCAIFADTGWESTAVYRHLGWLEGVADANGIRVHRVTAGNIREDSLIAQVRGKKTNGHRWAAMPLFTMQPGAEREGRIRRQCTVEYKIQPIEKFIRRELLGLKPRQRAPKNVVRQWFGISIDEWQRARVVNDHWREVYYPLIERRISMLGCLKWLEDHGYPEPPRSACIGCPFHSNAVWRDMQRNRPAEFGDACQVDEALRNSGGMRGQIYLHRSCKPLREVDFRNDFDRGQLSLFDDFGDECAGVCGV